MFAKCDAPSLLKHFSQRNRGYLAAAALALLTSGYLHTSYALAESSTEAATDLSESTLIESESDIVETDALDDDAEQGEPAAVTEQITETDEDALALESEIQGYTLPGPESVLSPASSAVIQLQRSQYIAALDALKKKRYSAVDKYLETLDGYPLKPYLEYEQLRRRLHTLPYQEIDKFLDQYAGSYVGDQLDRRWLKLLADRNRWHDYQTYFASSQVGKGDAEFECYNLLARYRSGEERALKEVAPLWNVGRSQPKACDPLFKAWMTAGHLTPEIAWERHSKAIIERKRELARYIARQMPADLQKLSALYLEVDRYPEIMKQHRRFADQSPAMNEIILHGLRRYSRRDAIAALEQWEKYNTSHYFDSADYEYTQEYLITQLARKGHLVEAQQLLAKSGRVRSEELIAWMARDALSKQDWQSVYDAIQLFSLEEQQSERWLYWRARTMQELDFQDPAYPTPEQIYSSLALTRGFYGFMAADIVGHEYTLIDRPVNSSADLIEIVANIPSVQRAYELLQLGNHLSARREWYYTTRTLPTDQLLAAGKLAESWGWYRQSIQSTISARHWDDLQLRFPLAYQTEVEFAAKQTNIASTYLFAIARQESAFAADARSPAGAMGLMQLMPATAKQTARKIGVKYQYWDLINPEQNIELGSRYLDELLEEFNGNRVLATAAYNAGPYRVKQWLKNTDEQLPHDIWIETIPFKETRGYVQNVLAFSVIYGYRLGQQTALLSADEQRPPRLTLVKN